MKLATIRTSSGTAAVRVDDDGAVELGSVDLGEFLARPDWRTVAESAAGARHEPSGLDYAPPVPRPEKILCVGLNYRTHIVEMPAGSQQVDWEAELGVVIGAEIRHATAEQAVAAIAGYTVVNDVTARDFQYRSVEWLQGKTFERSTPVGPWLVTDALPGVISCEVDGDVVQKADTSDLVFGPADLVAYISQIITLVLGDLIATGTPGGVGHARKPARYLSEGSELVTRVEGVGELRNTMVKGA
jgi:acylpyruvate hydrolase